MLKEVLVAKVAEEVVRSGKVDGTALSKDRITRIKVTAARVKLQGERRNAPAVEGE